MDARTAIAGLEAAIGDPRNGLPEEIFLFVGRVAPLINVDLLIQDEGRRTLLTWRDDKYFGSGWHVPGGIIRYKEMAADRVRACALAELGAEVSFEAAPLLVSETVREERERGHFISLLYRCRLLAPPDERLRAKLHPPRAGEWRWHDRCPPNLLPAQSQYATLL